MQKKPFIRNSIALLLLIIFTFSITPKQWIHDCVFDHKDTYTQCIDGSPKAHLHKAGFHCELDNIIVLSPFISDFKNAELTVLLVYIQQEAGIVEDLYSSPHFFIELRGPPPATMS